MHRLPRHLYASTIARALEEDFGPRLTSIDFLEALHKGKTVKARCFFKEEAVMAGGPIFREVFAQTDEACSVEILKGEGERCEANETLIAVTGPLTGVLAAERTALNFLQRLSSIATMTAAYVAAIDGTGVRIADTRKTTPTLRALEKYAVAMGGGSNHRFGLYDAVIIKDNFIGAGGTIAELVAQARAAIPHTTKIVVEAETLTQVLDAVDAGADVVLLDNMNPDSMAQAVAGGRSQAQGPVLFEASGGITLENAREVAETGVDVISVGALTHSVRGLDLSLELE